MSAVAMAMDDRISLGRPAGFGGLAAGLLLAVYFGALTALSGWTETARQFSEFWLYIVPLAAGFGVQVALYVRLRQILHRSKETRAVVAASGTTSTVAMVSCCAHYLVNVAPVLGGSSALPPAPVLIAAVSRSGAVFSQPICAG